MESNLSLLRHRRNISGPVQKTNKSLIAKFKHSANLKHHYLIILPVWYIT